MNNIRVPPAGEGPPQHHAHLHLHGRQRHAAGRRLQLQSHRQDGADGHTCSDPGEAAADKRARFTRVAWR